MTRREILHGFAGGFSLALLGAKAAAAGLPVGKTVFLRCLGTVEGPRYLDGRTRDGSVGLAPHTRRPFSGTRWRVVNAGNGAVALECRGDVEGPRWLDGRTADGSVGLAPNRNRPFTGTRWEVLEINGAVALRCLGEIDGPRWLDGRTGNGTVGLAKSTDPPFTGTRWRVEVPID
jgi:hypothetical protein